MAKFTPDEVLNSWQNSVKKDYSNRFLYGVREEILEQLAEMLMANEIELDDARFLKMKVKKFLVTEEGLKGKNRYKGWTDNVDKDYDAMLVEYYSNNKVQPTIVKDYGHGAYMDENPIMTAWAKDSFGVVWTKELNLLVHQTGHRFNLDFQKEVLDSNWAKTGENVPEWAQFIFIS